MNGEKIRYVLAAMLATLATASQAARISLDLREASGPKAPVRLMTAAKPLDTGVLRQGRLPAGSSRTASANVGDELDLELFDGVQIGLRLVERNESPLGGRSFLAEVSGYEGVKNAVVVETPEGLQIDIQDYDAGRAYTVFSSADGVVVREIDPNAGVVIPTAPLVPELPESSLPPVSASLQAVGQQVATCIDVLVAYDRNALRWANAQGGGITNFATVSVQKMNTALGNTGLDAKFRFRLVGAMAVDDETTDLDTALRAATSGTGGWAPIKAMRDAVGADIVTVLIDTGSAYGTTGLGWSLVTTSFASFSDNAYNACAIRSVAQSHTMTHECGHNLGAGHSDRQDTQPGPQLYPYSSGYYFKVGSTSYHTIMAYGSDGYTDVNYTAVPFFSSPSHAYSGVAVGDSSHDNTKTLLQTYAAAAKWRNQVVPESYDVLFDPPDGTAFDTSLNVTLQPGKTDVAVRYTTDGSEPTLSSPLYSGAITVRDTTTIKAATVVGGKLGPVFQARYLKKSIGLALNAPQYEWETSENCPWEYQTTDTYDGVHALSASVPVGSDAWVKTMITGPKVLEFRYKLNGSPTLTVMAGETVLKTVSFSGYNPSFVKTNCELPVGTYELKFNLRSRSGTTTGALDDLMFYDTLSPTFDPPTSDSASSSYTFERCMMVSINHPQHDAKIFYTTDGTAPDSDGALLYEGPFEIFASTKVRAIAITPGCGASAEVVGVFSERHRPKAGEWTTNVDGAKAAAGTDGRLVAIESANFLGCYYTQTLEPIARGEAFLSWAEANGVYLVSADTGRNPDASDAYSAFSSLYSQSALRTSLNGSIYYPTFVLAKAADPSTCAGAFVARSGRSDIGGITYDGTAESLIACFASALGSTPPKAPVIVSADGLGATYPVSVTIQNPNGSGTVYYTLDGSAPTPDHGIRYTSGTICVSSAGVTLKAAVWPTSGGVSSPVAVQQYRDIGSFFGTDGVTWQNDANLPWAEYSAGWLRGGKDLTMTSGTKTSTLKAEVRGPGRFIFDYHVGSGGGAANVEFKVNGVTVEKWYSGENGSFVQDVSSSGETTLEWVYTYVYYDSYESRRGAIGNVKWLHAPSSSPTGLAASDGDYTNGVYVTWEAFSGASAYQLYRCANAQFLNPVLVKETDKTLAWDLTAEGDKKYWYAVKAVNAFGASGFSAVDEGWRANPLRIADASLPTAYKTVAYAHQLTAIGGKAPYTWSAGVVGDAYRESRKSSSFSAKGTAKSWKMDDSCWTLDLPFAFPFCGKTYSKAYVSSNGTLAFDQSFSDYQESVDELKKHSMIAVFWDDLKTTDGDIYVSSGSDAVTIRWQGVAYSDSGAVNFSVTLYRDGKICLSYGTGNANKGLVGLSAGDGATYQVAAVSQKGSLGNAQDVIFDRPVLPTGFSLSADGRLTGLPSAKGSSTFAVRVTDANGMSDERDFTLTVADSFYTVTFDLGTHGTRTGGGELVQRVTGGSAAVAPTVTTETGWRFKGWSESFGDVRKNLTVVAQYESYPLAKALDCEGISISTGGDMPWQLDFAQHHEGESSLCSGIVGDLDETWVEATVVGEGTLTFWWKVSSEIYKATPVDGVAFSVDGGERAKIGGVTEWAQVTVDVAGSGAHVLRWTYAKDISDAAGEDCAWLDGVKFVARSAGASATPDDGFWAAYPALLSAAGGDKEAAAKRQSPGRSGKGKTRPSGEPVYVWEDFVAGTNPEDETDLFRAEIVVDSNGAPHVRWNHPLNGVDAKTGECVKNGIRVYRVWGRNGLSEGDAWFDVDKTPGNYRFFKVTVDMQ